MYWQFPFLATLWQFPSLPTYWQFLSLATVWQFLSLATFLHFLSQATFPTHNSLILQFHWICILRTCRVPGERAPYNKFDINMAEVPFLLLFFFLPSPLREMLPSPHDWFMYIYIFPTTPNTFFKHVQTDITIKRAVVALWYSCTP